MPQTMEDAKGDQWSFRFTGATAIRLRDELGIDIDRLISGDDDELDAILSSGWRLYEILAIVLEGQIDARKLVVTRTRTNAKGVLEQYEALADEFYERFMGEALDRATIAFLLAVSDSLPKLKRETLRALVTRISRDLDTAIEKLTTKVETMEIETKLDKAIEESGL